jgi:hypothetical protein
MKTTNDYIPRPDAERNSWLTNFKDRIAQFGPGLGLSAAEISSAQGNCAAVIAKINAVTAAKAALASAVTAKNAPTVTRYPNCVLPLAA